MSDGSLWEHVRHGSQDIYAAFVVFYRCLWNFESAVAVGSAVASTSFYFFFDFGEQYFAAKLSWTFAALAVVFPLTHEIKHTFHRREQALDRLASVKSLLINIYTAHANWDWPQLDGRNKLEPDHAYNVEQSIKELLQMLSSYLCLPTATRARNIFTAEGRQERAMQLPVQKHFFAGIYTGIRRLSMAVETMKEQGLPANEASRINQYHNILLKDLEVLHNIKEYRTPQGTRSFARVFIHLLPWLYGPYFVWVAHTLHPGSRSAQGFIFSTILSVFMSTAMVGLYNVQRGMQDPFEGDSYHGFDHIHTEIMCREIIHAIKVTAHDGSEGFNFEDEAGMSSGWQSGLCVP